MENLKAGDLDPGFGQGGRLELGQGRANVRFRRFYQDAAQRILGTGSSEQIGTGANRVTVARFTDAGTLDSTFNEDGYWLYSAVKRGDGGLDVSVQADGACIVAALRQGQIVLLHHSAQGQTREWVLTPEDAMAEVNAVVAVQAVGPSWIACSYLQPDWSGRILLTRRRPDTHPDHGFAKDGTLVLGQGTEALQLVDMAVRSTEHDVILALKASGGPTPGYWLYCLDADTGELKDAFAGDGKFTFSVQDPAYHFTGFNRILYDKGQLWLAGHTIERATGAFHCFFVRLTSEGVIDMGFNNGNPVIIKGMQPDVGVQRDGKVLLLASTVYPDNVLRRYLYTGELDQGFGQQGEVIVGREDEQIKTLLVQSDDKLLCGAYAASSGALSLGLYRLLG